MDKLKFVADEVVPFVTVTNYSQEPTTSHFYYFSTLLKFRPFCRMNSSTVLSSTVVPVSALSVPSCSRDVAVGTDTGQVPTTCISELLPLSPPQTPVTTPVSIQKPVVVKSEPLPPTKKAKTIVDLTLDNIDLIRQDEEKVQQVLALAFKFYQMERSKIDAIKHLLNL